MLYTPLTKKALKLAYAAHAGQVDKAGMPYIFHPYEVALQVQAEEEVCAALLHDVVEDTDWTMEDLRAAGFPETVLDHNSERTRFDADSPDIEKRLQKYAAARAVLDEAEKEKSSEFKRNS